VNLPMAAAYAARAERHLCDARQQCPAKEPLALLGLRHAEAVGALLGPNARHELIR
jgi:hypothetical protein